MKTLTGVIHGHTIHLHNPPPLAEEAEVEIVIRASRLKRVSGEGFVRTEGALANDPDGDEIMDEFQQSRHVERQPQGAPS